MWKHFATGVNVGPKFSFGRFSLHGADDFPIKQQNAYITFTANLDQKFLYHDGFPIMIRFIAL